MSLHRNVKTALIATALGVGLAVQAAAPANAFDWNRASQIAKMHPIFPYHRTPSSSSRPARPTRPDGDGWGRRGGWGRGAAFVAGTMVGAAMSQAAAAPRAEAADYSSYHVRRCLDHYRSYDPASDTFVGYDGRHHYCRL